MVFVNFKIDKIVDHYPFVTYLWEQTKLNFNEKIKDLKENDLDFMLGHHTSHRFFKELIFKEKELADNEIYTEMI